MFNARSKIIKKDEVRTYLKHHHVFNPPFFIDQAHRFGR
jgi:hypothetical protein